MKGRNRAKMLLPHPKMAVAGKLAGKLWSTVTFIEPARDVSTARQYPAQNIPLGELYADRFYAA